MKKYILGIIFSLALQADMIKSVQIGLEGWYENSSGSFDNVSSFTDLNDLKLQSSLNPSLSI